MMPRLPATTATRTPEGCGGAEGRGRPSSIAARLRARMDRGSSSWLRVQTSWHRWGHTCPVTPGRGLRRSTARAAPSKSPAARNRA